jgi:tetratricopeptide (TPR) repeat protein
VRLAATLAILLGAGGCGDAALWTRWQAERGLWRAQRAVQQIETNPRIASEARWVRAAAACSAVVHRFPASVWAARAAGGSGLAADVLEASGRAALLGARLEELRGRSDEALADYERVGREYRPAVRISEQATETRARLLERAGRTAQAEEAWRDLAQGYPPVDPRGGALFEAVLDAPLFVARERRARGDVRGMDSVLRAAEATYLRMLPGQRGRPAAPALWVRLSEARSARGDGAGGLAALRQALADPAAEPLAPRLVLTMAQRALDEVGADTALAYARWAALGFDGAARPAGLLLAGRAWQALGAPDSALRTWEVILDEQPDGVESAAEARYARARLLEERGRWDQARSEYHALAGSAPDHPLALDGLLRIVRHHLRNGETTLGMAEARHAVEALDARIESQQDDSVQVRVGQARARLLFEMDDVRRACGALAALLRRFPEAPLDAELLAEAAERADTRLANTDLALVLYRAAAVRAGEPDLRRRAREAVERLTGPPH